MTKNKENNNDTKSFLPLFTIPVMQVHLDLDLEKLTELTFQIQNKDKKGVQVSNRGGWQSNNIGQENHEELNKLKKEITQHLKTYYSDAFQGMKFKADLNIMQGLDNMWVNINEKHHYNEWHIHGFSTLSGVYYIKHDRSKENGDIIFKNPNGAYLDIAHWPKATIEGHNEITSETIRFTPHSNMLLIFPSWLQHKVAENLKNDSRISLSFNTRPLLEKKS